LANLTRACFPSKPVLNIKCSNDLYGTLIQTNKHSSGINNTY
jgi:hypothetical protein